MRFGIMVLLICELILASCESVPDKTPMSAEIALTEIPISLTFDPVVSNPTMTSSPPPPTATAGLWICLPLPGMNLQELHAAVSNPYNPPPLGSDDPHQGVDLAIQHNRIALAGSPVMSILRGQVSAVIDNRFPYGYALLVETPIRDIPDVSGLAGQLPTPMPTLASHPSLTCPKPDNPPNWDIEHRFLYILYAHLVNRPAFQPGESISCGQEIGFIGQSGNALNPHVHIEIRIGPAQARLASLSHYDSRATLQEMSNYCTWRVSGLFQHIDPFFLLDNLP